MSFAKILCRFLVALVLISSSRAAESVVQLPGGNALLNAPAGKAKAGLVLLTGGDGNLGIGADGSVARQGNWIVRTRGVYAASGMASLLVDGGVDVNLAIAHMRQIAPKVVVVAMSRGSLKIPAALNSNPNGIVLASSFLGEMDDVLGDASRLPPTLVVHHKLDTCRYTSAEDVPGFMQWAGKRARLVWVDGGTSEGDPCQARAYHGFIGREGQVTSAISSFALGVK